MAGGSLGLPSSNFSNNIEKDDESVKSDFANAREEPNGYYPTHISSQNSKSGVSNLKSEIQNLKSES